MSNLATFSAVELMRMRFPEPKWAVPGIVCEGLNLLAGAPKFGKSWLCLNLAVAIASGGKALGSIDVEQGSVLYAALEDTPRRLQSRLDLVMQGQPVPDGIDFVTEMPRMPEATSHIADWLHEHPDARLVIIDVLRKVRPVSDGRLGRSAYDEDYDTMGNLKALADEFSVAIILVHHTRKMADESDVFNEVAGSTGLSGAADAILVAKRSRNTTDAVLHLTGRDVTEAEFGLLWNAQGCTWTLAGDDLGEARAAAHAARVMGNVGDTMASILDLAARRPAGITAKDVTDALDVTADKARQYLSRAERDGRLERAGRGIYVTVTSVTSVTNPSQSQLADVVPLSQVSRSPEPILANVTHVTDECHVADPALTTADTPNVTHVTHVTPTTCVTCGLPMTTTHDGQTTHPTCEEA